MWNNVIIRPVREADLEGVFQLSLKSKDGLTSFPKNKTHLALKIAKSCHSFSKKVELPHDEFYFFVMEDLQLQKIIGVCSIIASVGISDPFYSFLIQTLKKESWCLDKEISIDLLKLHRLYNGPSEIGTLFLDPDYRIKGLGRLLSLSRFAYISRFPHRFKSTIIAEMRGVSDDHGSPFWKHVGSHFFDLSFMEADRLSSENKQFIAELIPKYPIYINLLHADARAVIGQVHKNTVPALQLLLKEGFRVTSFVDIFDAGPKIEIETKKLRFFSELQPAKTVLFQDSISDASDFKLACNGNEEEFIVSFCTNEDGRLIIPERIKPYCTSDFYSADLIPNI